MSRGYCPSPNYDSLLEDSRWLTDPSPEEEDHAAYIEWANSDEGQSQLEMDEQIDAMAAVQCTKFELVDVSHPGPLCACSGCERWFSPPPLEQPYEYALRDAVQRSDAYLQERAFPETWPDAPPMSVLLRAEWERE